MTVERVSSVKSTKNAAELQNSAVPEDKAKSKRRRRDFRSSITSADLAKSTDRITYTWKNINVWTGEPPDETKVKNIDEEASNGCFERRKAKPSKQILNNVSGIVRPGELVAMMGASGAGKTTLLNVMTFRNTGKLRVSGERAVNGVPVGPDSITAVSAYIQQDDLFIGSLTVREHLIFQALVRMHKHIPYDERMSRVEEVIHELGLTKCADTVIGSPGRVKGISGGEMKRLAFACEVLTDPALYFADEPTSGLDSYMAQTVINVLKELAQKGKTIICTIHQPSSQVYAMFDRVLFMAEGRVAYMGDADKALEFFNTNGYACPSNFNPSDFFVQTLAIQPGFEVESRKNVTDICNNFARSEDGLKIKSCIEARQRDSQSADYLKAEAKSKNRSPYKASWLAQFRAVIWRSWITNLKDPVFLKVKCFQTLLISLVMGLAFFGQKFNQDSVQNICGVLFMMITNMTFSNAMGVINVFCLELPIFLREHFNGMYRCDVYFLSKSTAELPFYIIFPSLFVCINYFMIGLNSDAIAFFKTLGIIVLVANCAVSFGYLMSCISSSIAMAMALTPAVMVIILLFGGFFLNTGSIPVYLFWIRYISWFYYGNEALAVTQWRDIDYIECNRENSTCPANGAAVLKTFDFKPENFLLDIMALFILIIVIRILAFLVLLSKTRRRN